MLSSNELLEYIEWLLEITQSDVSPDAYFAMLQLSDATIIQIFDQVSPHAVQIADVSSGVGIICLQRRNLSRFGLFFLREALSFNEDVYAHPINTECVPRITRDELLKQVRTSWSGRFADRYTAPAKGSFSDFEAYYSQLCAREIFDDVGSLPDVTAINRLLAMFARLTDLACGEFTIPPNEREQAAILCGAIEDSIRTNQAPEVVQRFEAAAQAQFSFALTHAPFKDTAALIAEGAFSKERPRERGEPQ